MINPTQKLIAAALLALALTSSASAATEVTVLVAASDRVQTLSGGAAGLRALINSRITYCNQGFARSSLDVTYRLVGTTVLTGAETRRSGLDTMFTYFTTNTAVSTLRDQVKADLVGGLFSNVGTNGRSGTWGSAYMVSAYDNANIFMHEFGHNFGCGHHPDRDAGGRFAYSKAHDFYTSTGVHAATIMGSGINISPVSPVFSSPTVSYQGGVTGTPERDNVRTINDGKATVAAYK